PDSCNPLRLILISSALTRPRYTRAASQRTPASIDPRQRAIACQPGSQNASLVEAFVFLATGLMRRIQRKRSDQEMP
ncbi:hypothetical protein, partial [Xanthomonas hortorum]|uniref:hypothetical protein n=1 Tax=Xanthomonas hortorum TaxID=56454 RepID=UPI002044B166